MNILEFDHRNNHAKDDHDAAVRKYLVSNGWKYTSRHPGSIWLWTFDKVTESEQFDDEGTLIAKHERCQTYAVQESVALQIQRYWELEAQDFNTHDESCPIFVTFDWDDCNCMGEASED